MLGNPYLKPLESEKSESLDTQYVFMKVVQPGLKNYVLSPHTRHGVQVRSVAKERSFVPSFAQQIVPKSSRSNKLIGGLSPGHRKAKGMRDYWRSTGHSKDDMERQKNGMARETTKLPALGHSYEEGREQESPPVDLKALLSAERYLSKFPPKFIKPEDRPPRVQSIQQRRWEDGEQHQRRTKVLKRMAEIIPHRVDHLYYLRGSPIRTGGRYDYDPDQLQSLTDLEEKRYASVSYGRGLSETGTSTGTPPTTAAESHSVEKRVEDADGETTSAPKEEVFLTQMDVKIVPSQSEDPEAPTEDGNAEDQTKTGEEDERPGHPKCGTGPRHKSKPGEDVLNQDSTFVPQNETKINDNLDEIEKGIQQLGADMVDHAENNHDLKGWN